MKKVLEAAVAAALILVPAGAEAGEKKQNVNGYAFVNKDWVMTEYTMKWQFVESQKELEATVRAEGIRVAEDDGDPIMDNVRIRRNRATGVGTCTATIVSPEKRVDAEVMLHVQLHCIYGRWHDAPKFGPRMQTAGM